MPTKKKKKNDETFRYLNNNKPSGQGTVADVGNTEYFGNKSSILFI